MSDNKSLIERLKKVVKYEEENYPGHGYSLLFKEIIETLESRPEIAQAQDFEEWWGEYSNSDAIDEEMDKLDLKFAHAMNKKHKEIIISNIIALTAMSARLGFEKGCAVGRLGSQPKQRDKENPEITEIKELIAHAWVHNGYPNCGYEKMASAQKYLYSNIIDETCKE